MNNDDLPTGRVLSRREVLALLAGAGAAMLVGSTKSAFSAAPACVVKPEMTEGPYFLDKQLNRSDVRSEPSDGSLQEGVPLALAFKVSQVGGGMCVPLAGAMVDIWHCNAQGIYSGVSDRGLGFDTRGKKFLRGYQVTDANGAARFVTVYPGWYPGRTVHIHFKIRTKDLSNQSYEFTSQLYFADAFSDRLFARAPYARKTHRRTTNAHDMIYSDGGERLLLAPTQDGQGYAATFAFGLDLSDAKTGRAGWFGNPGGNPPRRPPR